MTHDHEFPGRCRLGRPTEQPGWQGLRVAAVQPCLTRARANWAAWSQGRLATCLKPYRSTAASVVMEVSLSRYRSLSRSCGGGDCPPFKFYLHAPRPVEI